MYWILLDYIDWILLNYIVLNSIEFNRIQLNSIELYWIILNCIEFYWIILIEFYWILLNYIVLNSIELYWILLNYIVLNSIELYWILLNYIDWFLLNSIEYWLYWILNQKLKFFRKNFLRKFSRADSCVWRFISADILETISSWISITGCVTCKSAWVNDACKDVSKFVSRLFNLIFIHASSEALLVRYKAFWIPHNR